jgi:hypothetical protein
MLAKKVRNHHHSNRKRNISIFISLLLLFLFGAYLFRGGHSKITALIKSSISSGRATTASQSIDVTSRLVSDWKNIVNNRGGLIDIAVYNHNTGKIAHYSNSGGTFNTASIVKLSILEALLLDDQNNGESLTYSQLADATPMIENSDNNAATDLWDLLGGAPAMDSFFNQIGATSTTAGLQDEWGLTQTTALDQLKVLNALAYPGTTLTESSATAANSLLDQVEPDQRWGVSGGIPAGVGIELKNGWLPDADTSNSYENTDDWIINSIGHIHGDGADYTIAVLTDGNSSEQYGIDTIQSLSATTWNDLNSKN